MAKKTVRDDLNDLQDVNAFSMYFQPIRIHFGFQNTSQPIQLLKRSRMNV